MYWNPDEMVIPQAWSTIAERKDELRNIKRIGSLVLRVHFIAKKYIPFRNDSYEKYIDQYLSYIYDCYIGEVSETICSIKNLASDQHAGFLTQVIAHMRKKVMMKKRWE